jgi:hypothetical protein
MTWRKRAVAVRVNSADYQTFVPADDGTVQYKHCTVPSSAGVGVISRLNIRGHRLLKKVITSSHRQCKCC